MDKPSLVHRICSLYPGEVKRTFKFVLLASLTFGVTYGINTLVDGLFLEELGSDSLPMAYLTTSISCLFLAMLTLRALTHLSVRAVFLSFCLSGAVMLGLAAWLTRNGVACVPPVFWHAYKIGSYSYLIVMYTQLWSFIDHCFEFGEVKRLYGLFNAATLLGASGGSALVSLLIRYVSPSTIFGLYGLVMLLILAVSFTTKPALPAQPEPEASEQKGLTLWELLREVARSRFVLYLLTFNTLMLFLEVFAEYHYMVTMGNLFTDADVPNALTQFIGKCRGWVFLGMTLFGILAYSRMVRRLGLKFAILIPPLYFGTLFALWLITDCLVLGVMGLLAVEGILGCIEDSNFNLMINACGPRLKVKLRVTAEQILEPGAMLFSSGLLMAFQSFSKLLGLMLGISALVVCYLLRKSLPAVTQAEVNPAPSQGLLNKGCATPTTQPQHVAY